MKTASTEIFAYEAMEECGFLFGTVLMLLFDYDEKEPDIELLKSAEKFLNRWLDVLESAEPFLTDMTTPGYNLKFFNTLPWVKAYMIPGDDEEKARSLLDWIETEIKKYETA